MNIGLVLAGGMAKGAYQVGALRALSNYVPLNEIEYMSCASIGVLNGYAYATGNLDKAEQMWMNFCEDGEKLLINQVLRSNYLQESILNICDPEKPIDPTFYCSLLDFGRRNIVYKDLSSVDMDQLPLYLKASVAMPIFNRSVAIDDTSYFDGAMIDNIPVYPLIAHNLDYIICVYFDDTCYKFESTYFDNKVIKITFPCESMLKQSLVFKRDGIVQMIEDGYERTMQLLEPIFSEGYANLEHIYNAIEYANKNTKNSLRITGDVLTTNFNKITQKLTRKKVM